MKVAVVGSRQGYDLNHLGSWLHALWQKQGPTTTLISGGADGVDRYAETTWIAFGGQVKSFRPVKVSDWNEEDEWGIEVWELGGPSPMVYRLIDHPTFADFGSAASYRDMLIAEEAERGVAFRANNSRGTTLTVGFFENLGKLVYLYEEGSNAQS